MTRDNHCPITVTDSYRWHQRQCSSLVAALFLLLICTWNQLRESSNPGASVESLWHGVDFTSRSTFGLSCIVRLGWWLPPP